MIKILIIYRVCIYLKKLLLCYSFICFLYKSTMATHSSLQSQTYNARQFILQKAFNVWVVILEIRNGVKKELRE
jgi:hypothetical protein